MRDVETPCYHSSRDRSFYSRATD
uniref:Uncharacterized protein n=1 Tax=Anguilla anguilla TaxID=7936 RepID=A0A0E9SQV5_ANGAN